VLFVMLNPSIADATTDDPTLRRCLAFARTWGFGYLDVCNLFAHRSAHPDVLKAVADPVGPRNDRVIAEVAARANRIVVAWGARGSLRDRAERVLSAILTQPPLHCFGRTCAGEPRHPLYLPQTTRIARFR
jgi:hypothetical protein